MAAAGIITGIGDGRTEKGTFDYGQFEVVDDGTPELLAQWQSIVEGQGRAVQEEALAKPVAYDQDTEELLAYFESEIVRRDFVRSKAEPAAIDMGTAISKPKRGRPAKKKDFVTSGRHHDITAER